MNAPSLIVARGTIVRILLNRPEKRNAIDFSMISALEQALNEADADEQVRVVTIRGAGGDFCSGVDLRELDSVVSQPIEASIADVDRLARLFVLIRRVRVPVVALVTGRALAGGCGLATACDLVLASEGSTFGYPEVGLGFVPAMVGAILRRNVSEKRAFELMTLGDRITAVEAARIGLINAAFPDEEFEMRADALVERLGASSGSAVQLCKRVLYQQDALGFEAGVRAGADVNVIARMTADFRSGLESFARPSAPKASED